MRGRGRVVTAVAAAAAFAVAAAAVAAVVLGAAAPARPSRVMPSPAGSASSEPFLTTAPGGRILLSWVETEPGRAKVRFSAWDGRHWSAPRTIVDSPMLLVNWVDVPSVCALKGGGIVAHWLETRQGGGEASDLRVAWSPDGGFRWSAPVQPYADTSHTEHGLASLVALSDRAFAVTWLDGRAKTPAAEAGGGSGRTPTGEMSLRMARATVASGRHGPELRLDRDEVLDARTCDCCPTAAVLARGAVRVFYRDRSPRDIRDIAQATIGRNARAVSAAVSADGWEVAGCPVNGPAATVLRAPREPVAVAWYTGAGPSAHVRVAFDTGRGFSPPIDVDDGNPLGRVTLARLDGGSVLVGWLERVEDAPVFRVRAVTAAGRASASHVVAADGGASGCPRLASSAREVVLAWTDAGTPSRVRTAVLPIAEARGWLGTGAEDARRSQ